MARIKGDVANLKSAMEAAIQENVAAEDSPNISSVDVVNSPIIDSKQYTGAYAAKAATAQHMNLIDRAGGKMMEVRSQFDPMVMTLKDIHLPDTKVNVENKKIDIPSDITKYASTMPQHTAINVLVGLLGKTRVKELYNKSSCAGQADKPTLWLVQKLVVETKMDYVWNLGVTLGATKVAELNQAVPADILSDADEALDSVLGKHLYSELKRIAVANHMAPIYIFIALFDMLIAKESEKTKPTQIASTWEAIRDILD